MTDLRSTIPALIARRQAVGAATPIGRRLSLLVEQIEGGVSPAQTVAEIAQIQRDGGEYIHANHMKGEA
jgi:2,4-dienoyl-CoA reductase-like NADH-dependent reductase (Old Yellow Enzyme family)